MPPSGYAVNVDGLKEMIARLAGDPIYARPWRRALGRISSNVKKLVKSQAPVASGRTARGVFYRMPGGIVPLYSIVSDRAKRKGIRYPFVVNAGFRSTKHGTVRLHFRGTSQSSEGWFQKAGRGAQAYVNQALATALAQIERAFEGKSND